MVIRVARRNLDPINGLYGALELDTFDGCGGRIQRRRSDQTGGRIDETHCPLDIAVIVVKEIGIRPHRHVEYRPVGFNSDLHVRHMLRLEEEIPRARLGQVEPARLVAGPGGHVEKRGGRDLVIKPDSPGSRAKVLIPREGAVRNELARLLGTSAGVRIEEERVIGSEIPGVAIAAGQLEAIERGSERSEIVRTLDIRCLASLVLESDLSRRRAELNRGLVTETDGVVELQIASYDPVQRVRQALALKLKLLGRKRIISTPGSDRRLLIHKG